MLRDCPPAAASLSICHESNNNVLSPQACSNTCCRDQLLANPYNNQSPRVQLCPENWTEMTGQHRQRKSRPNPSNLTLPFIPIPLFLHSLRENIIVASLSLGSFDTLKSLFSLPFLYSFAFPLASLWLRQAETCAWVLHKYYVHSRDNVRAWMWPSCVKFESMCCVYRYISLACNHEDSQWMLAGDSTQMLCATPVCLEIPPYSPRVKWPLHSRKLICWHKLLKFDISFIRLIVKPLPPM